MRLQGKKFVTGDLDVGLFYSTVVFTVPFIDSSLKPATARICDAARPVSDFIRVEA